MGPIENAGALLVNNGIIVLKKTNPAAWGAFKVGLHAVAVGSTELDNVTDDDNVTAKEITACLEKATNYGAARTLLDMIWGLLKHVKG